MSDSGSVDSDDNDVVKLTPSADEILDVSQSPVPDPEYTSRSRVAMNDDAFSSSSSSSSGEDRSSSSSANSEAKPQSEFDKALKTSDGVPHKGSATFDPFLVRAESNVVDEAISEAGSAGTSLASQPNTSVSLQQKQRQGRVVGGKESLASSQQQKQLAGANRAQSPPRTSLTSGTGTIRPKPEDLSEGVLPDVLMTMRQKIESLTLFDSDMMKLAEVGGVDDGQDGTMQQERESMKRSFQQSISAAVLVSLAHKRYERRRLAAMEIEKVIRSLVQAGELERVRAILLLLSDDYVRSVSEDARKGGVVALAACAIGLKKASSTDDLVQECRELILTSVLHACQDHSSRVRYYATESLFNIIKVIPIFAVQHFFILFEILRSLYADVDIDVRSGAELLDKKLKEVIVGAINSGNFTADACVPVFARFVSMPNKATKQLTLSWLQELSEKLVGAPILEFLHLFLGGIFAMVADPHIVIRQSALAFLQSVLPKLLVVHQNEFSSFGENAVEAKVDFDKILQSLVTTMEHPDPFVRKVAMYWMSRIVKAHMGNNDTQTKDTSKNKSGTDSIPHLTAASISVRNSLPHVLPGILLSIGDTFNNRSSTKDSFLPDQTTRSLAEQTNACLQEAVRRDGSAYVSHLDGFIVALREELDSPGGLSGRNPPAVDRKPYRMDVKQDGSGIESTGWFRSAAPLAGGNNDGGTSDKEEDASIRGKESMIMSRQCALEWVIVLYDSVVPNVLKAEYAREFITPIIDQLVDNPPELIIFKSLQVLARITVPARGERANAQHSDNSWEADHKDNYPMTDENASFALDVMDPGRQRSTSRDREVFSALIRLHSYNGSLLSALSRVIQFMCTLQPAEFVFVSFALELDSFIKDRAKRQVPQRNAKSKTNNADIRSFSKNLEFVSSFVQQMSFVLLNTEEAKELRHVLLDCIGSRTKSQHDRRRARLFHIILHSFSHNAVSTVSLCLWGGAFRTASTFLYNIDPLEINLMFLMELDQLVELLERPLFRHLHLRMLECDKDPDEEGSGAMLFRLLKSLLMITPQSTCYKVLKDRLVSVSRFRQSAIASPNKPSSQIPTSSINQLQRETNHFVRRIFEVREFHCVAKWQTIRGDSLESPPSLKEEDSHDEGTDRRKWLGYVSREDEAATRQSYRGQKSPASGLSIEEISDTYKDFDSLKDHSVGAKDFVLPNDDLPRHPDKVLPKDQIHNFQTLTRYGLVHPVGKRENVADSAGGVNASKNDRDEDERAHEASGRSGVGTDGENEWKDYWGQPVSDTLD